MSIDDPTVQDLRFRCLSNALYHVARRRYLESRGRFLNLLTILGGTATVVNLVNDYPNLQVLTGFLVTFVGALQLVYDYSGRARTHEILQRRYYEMLGSIEENPDPSADFCKKLMGEIARVSGEEPPTYRALDAIAYNEALDALYGDERSEARCQISLWQSLTRNLFHHTGATFISRKA